MGVHHCVPWVPCTADTSHVLHNPGWTPCGETRVKMPINCRLSLAKFQETLTSRDHQGQNPSAAMVSPNFRVMIILSKCINCQPQTVRFDILTSATLPHLASQTHRARTSIIGSSPPRTQPQKPKGKKAFPPPGKNSSRNSGTRKILPNLNPSPGKLATPGAKQRQSSYQNPAAPTPSVGPKKTPSPP